MTVAIYLGDEVGGLGFRLAGVDVRVPHADAELLAFEEARSEAALVLVSASMAARIPSARLSAAMQALAPIVAVVPDLERGAAQDDTVTRLRSELGLGT